MTLLQSVITVYLAGVAVGLAVMRDPWPTRLVTAGSWPLGLLAFALVVGLMVAAAVYLWPLYVLGTVAVASLLWLAI